MKVKPHEQFITEAKILFSGPAHHSEFKALADSLDCRIPWSKIEEFKVDSKHWNFGSGPEEVNPIISEVTSDEENIEIAVDTKETVQRKRKNTPKQIKNKEQKKNEFKLNNPIFVVTQNEGLVVSSCQSFSSAWKALTTIALHGTPQKSEKEALEDIARIGRVELFIPKLRTLKANITKIELTA